MTRTVQIVFCVVLVGVVRGPADADDSWTSSLGRYTRALADQHRQEAEQAAQARAAEAGSVPAVRSQDIVRDYYYRGLLFDVDRGRHYDYRCLEHSVALLVNHPFPRAGVMLACMRSPDFYMQHEWMARHLDSRRFYRAWHYDRRLEAYTSTNVHFRYP